MFIPDSRVYIPWKNVQYVNVELKNVAELKIEISACKTDGRKYLFKSINETNKFLLNLLDVPFEF